MNLNYCHLCKTPWDNHSAACTMRPDAEVAALHAELSKLREELAEARKVMEELVALSDMKRKVCAEHGWPDHDVRADYKRRISAAWEQARAFLARKEAK